MANSSIVLVMQEKKLDGVCSPNSKTKMWIVEKGSQDQIPILRDLEARGQGPVPRITLSSQCKLELTVMQQIRYGIVFLASTVHQIRTL